MTSRTPAEVDALHGVANQLRTAAGSPCAANGAVLPALALITDTERLPDPLPAANNLPPGSAVLLRHYDHPHREALAVALGTTCRARGLSLWVAGDAALAAAAGAEGLHLAEWMVGTWRRGTWRGVVTAAAHSAAAIHAARRAGVDAVLLAPVFATGSHPGVATLGVSRARSLIVAARLPVYLAGGITASNADQLAGSGAAGIAALGGLSTSGSPKH